MPTAWLKRYPRCCNASSFGARPYRPEASCLPQELELTLAEVISRPTLHHVFHVIRDDLHRARDVDADLNSTRSEERRRSRRDRQRRQPCWDRRRRRGRGGGPGRRGPAESERSRPGAAPSRERRAGPPRWEFPRPGKILTFIYSDQDYHVRLSLSIIIKQLSGSLAELCFRYFYLN